MRKHTVGLGLLVIGIVFGVALSITAQGGRDVSPVPKGFLSGNDWLRLSRTEQDIYAIGVVDGLDLASAVQSSEKSLSWVNACVLGMRSDQVGAMLKAEVESNPGERDLLMVHRAMYDALRKACRNK